MRNIALVLLLLAGLFYLLDKSFSNALDDKDSYLRVVQILLILPIIVLSVARRQMPLSVILKNTAVWLFVALLLISGYSYRFALESYYNNIVGHIMPSIGLQREDGSVMFHTQNDGHFHIQSEINGKKITFLLDTGATKVAITQKDAIRIGIDVDSLKYDIRVSTANGVSLFARVVIPEIKIGPIIVRQVAAYVGKNGLDTSLLGMSFLSRLKEYEVTRDTLILRK
jgi:aspartyl protease family protein